MHHLNFRFSGELPSRFGEGTIIFTRKETYLMSPDSEIREFLERHIQAVMQNDIAAYTETTSPDLTIYEWWITPHRIDGLPFHEYMMAEMQRRNTAFGAETGSGVAPEAPSHLALTWQTCTSSATAIRQSPALPC